MAEPAGNSAKLWFPAQLKSLHPPPQVGKPSTIAMVRSLLVQLVRKVRFLKILTEHLPPPRPSLREVSSPESEQVAPSHRLLPAVAWLQLARRHHFASKGLTDQVLPAKQKLQENNQLRIAEKSVPEFARLDNLDRAMKKFPDEVVLLC